MKVDFYFYVEMSYQMKCTFFVVVMTFKTNRESSLIKGGVI